MLNNKYKNIVFVCSAILISICLLEIGSYLILKYSKLSNAAQLLSSETNSSGEKDVPAAYLIHPYYGFITNPRYLAYLKRTTPESPMVQDVPDVNKFGFFSDVETILKKDNARLVVALLGGSVASYEGTQGKEVFTKELERQFAKKVVLLNLALWAGKQPQQLMILNDLISQGAHFDIVINLDGFNEIALPSAHGNVPQHMSPFFPQSWKTLSETNFSFSEQRLHAYLYGIKFVNQTLNSVIRHFFIFNTAKLTYIIQNKILNNWSAALEQQVKSLPPVVESDFQISNDGRTFLGPWFGTSEEDPGYYDMLGTQWFTSSIMLHNLAASQGGKYFHFLQPNQYTNDKRLTEDENVNAVTSNIFYRANVERGYPVLRKFGKKLNDAGVNFHDLTTLFENADASVYRDSCCHFNQFGVDAIAMAIVTYIHEKSNNAASVVTIPQ
jgi:hypothetical protein